MWKYTTLGHIIILDGRLIQLPPRYLIFAITGSVSYYTHSELVRMVESAGHRMYRSILDIDFLVVGQGSSPGIIERARVDRIRRITELDLLYILDVYAGRVTSRECIESPDYTIVPMNDEVYYSDDELIMVQTEDGVVQMVKDYGLPLEIEEM